MMCNKFDLAFQYSELYFFLRNSALENNGGSKMNIIKPPLCIRMIFKILIIKFLLELIYWSTKLTRSDI